MEYLREQDPSIMSNPQHTHTLSAVVSVAMPPGFRRIFVLTEPTIPAVRDGERERKCGARVDG